MDVISEFWRDPAMPYAESRRACHSRACYKPHSHPTFSIGAVDQADPRDKEAALIEFIGEYDESQGLHINSYTSSPSQSKQIYPVLDFLRDNAAINTGLSDLAQLAGMSRYQLIRAFRAATGMTPHAWQLNQRINLARERIRTGEGLAEVAYRLGFADQAHFQRVFKAHAGVTPGCFRT